MLFISCVIKWFHNGNDYFADATNKFSLTEKNVNESVNCEEENGLQKSLCSYKWTKSDRKGEAVVSTEPTMRPDSSGLYRCTINCTVKRQPCSINRMMVNVVDSVSTEHVPLQVTTQTSKLFSIYSSD